MSPKFFSQAKKTSSAILMVLTHLLSKPSANVDAKGLRHLAASNFEDHGLLFNPDHDSANIGYHSFRIPSIVRTGSTSSHKDDHCLLAFAEGQQCLHEDFGNINIVYKKSCNDGKSWMNLREVVGVGPGTWGNPTAVYDSVTSIVWLFMSWNADSTSQFGHDNPCTGEPTSKVGEGDRKVYVTYSKDNGDTWAEPIDMTEILQPPGMTWNAVGPGVGIQLTEGEHAGRLVVPAIERNIYSNDFGKTWQYQVIPPGTSKGTIVELSDGSLMRNDRAVSKVWNTSKRRWVSYGTVEDGFTTFEPDNVLYDPKWEGSTLCYSDSSSQHKILFLNPASTVQRSCKMRVQLSLDDGKSWPVSRQLVDDCNFIGGYLSMAKTSDYHVATLVEVGGEHRSIRLYRFNLPWLLEAN